jgi:hypothetical protein
MMTSKNLTAVKASANILPSVCNVVFGSRHARERNDEVLERIYIGRRLKNDTERLEKLFELHTKMKLRTKPNPRRK